MVQGQGQAEKEVSQEYALERAISNPNGTWGHERTAVDRKTGESDQNARAIYSLTTANHILRRVRWKITRYENTKDRECHE